MEMFEEDRVDYLVALSSVEDEMPAISLEDVIKCLEFDVDLD